MRDDNKKISITLISVLAMVIIISGLAAMLIHIQNSQVNLEREREQRDLQLLYETAAVIKEAMQNDFTIDDEVRNKYHSMDLSLEELLNDDSTGYGALSGYLNSALGLKVHHSFKPVSRSAGSGKVYVRIYQNGTVELLITNEYGGQPAVCNYITDNLSYAYTDATGRRKMICIL